MTYLLLGLFILALVILAVHGFRGANTRRLAQQIRTAAPWILLLVAGAVALRGAIGVAIPLATVAALMLFRSGQRSSRPIGGPFGGGGDGGSGQTSQIVTDTLEMELDHGSGEIRGRVLRGIFEGRRIERLKPAELALLWQDVRVDDPQSAQLIEAYLDSVHPTWRDDVQRGEQDMRGPDGRMSREEAREILGVAEGAGKDEIRRAHKELMLKFHPDRGGSTYLASKINEAKEVLLRE